MRRFIQSALVVSAFSGFGLVGCGEESKVENKEVVASPEGKTVTTKSETISSTGKNPPANTAGETAKAPK
jgi:hypothetical protein